MNLVSLHTRPDGNVTDEFAQLLAALAEAFPPTRLTAAQIRVYARVLGDVPIEELRQAATRAVRSGGKFFPSASELRALARGSEQDAATLAWLAFRKAAADVGAYASLDVDDHAAAFALLSAFGSWPEFCAAEDGPALHARQREFEVAYREARRTMRQHAVPMRLAGICETEGTLHERSVIGRIGAAQAPPIRTRKAIE